MNFLYPQFLWALLAISIPIIIHLFNFRKFKKVYFSDLRLLKEVELQTSKKSNLKHLLILLCRILAIAALVFAFAQPYFPNQSKANAQGEKIVSIYVDNSYSMNNVAQEFSLLDKAKEHAETIAKRFKQSDKFVLITNDFEPKHQKTMTQQEVLELIQEIEPSSKTRKLSQIEQKQLDFLEKEPTNNKLGFYLSDFQKSTADLESIKSDTSVQISYVYLSPELADNVYIDTVWFDSPIRALNRKEVLYAKLVNNSEEDIQVKVELVINGKTEGFVNQDVTANSTSEVELNYMTKKKGMVRAKLKISEYPNPVSTFDDEFYFSYLLKDSAQILVINESKKNLDGVSGSVNQLFKNDSYFKVFNQSSGSIDYSQFSGSNLIVLNELNEFSSGLISELLNYMESGGNIVLFPGGKSDINSVNELMLGIQAGRFKNIDTTNTKVSFLNFDHPIFTDVFEKIPKNMDFPKVSKSYKLEVSSRARVERLMKLQTGNDFLSKFSYGTGSAYVFTVPLSKDFSNLSSHSLFVTSLLRIAESSGAKQTISQTISSNIVSMKDDNYELESIHITNEDLEIDFIPETQRVRGEVQFYIPEDIKEAGNYTVSNKTKLIGGFGLNYNREESNFDSYSIEELKKEVGSSSVINAIEGSFATNDSSLVLEDDFKWWKLFILLALLFIVCEMVLIKLMK